MKTSPGKCLVIGHRGASGYEPENTFRAFESAYQMGADGIELDIFLTKDHKIVVTHDKHTHRLTGVHKNVCHSTYAELKSLDFGKNQKIPLLADVFEEFLKKFVIINIEIKSTGFLTNGIEKILAQLIRDFKCEEQVQISSFNPFNLLRFKALMPNIRMGYLICKEQNLMARNRFALSLVGPTRLHLDHKMLAHKNHRFWFDLPFPIWLWTVNTREEMEFWLSRKPEAIITNFPDKLRELVVGCQI